MSTNSGFDPFILPAAPVVPSRLSDIDDIRQSASPAIFIAHFNTLLKITRPVSSPPLLDPPFSARWNTDFTLRVTLPGALAGLVNAQLCYCCRRRCLAEKLRLVAPEESKETILNYFR